MKKDSLDIPAIRFEIRLERNVGTQFYELRYLDFSQLDGLTIHQIVNLFPVSGQDNLVFNTYIDITNREKDTKKISACIYSDKISVEELYKNNELEVSDFFSQRLLEDSCKENETNSLFPIHQIYATFASRYMDMSKEEVLSELRGRQILKEKFRR